MKLTLALLFFAIASFAGNKQLYFDIEKNNIDAIFIKNVQNCPFTIYQDGMTMRFVFPQFFQKENAIRITKDWLNKHREYIGLNIIIEGG